MEICPHLAKRLKQKKSRALCTASDVCSLPWLIQPNCFLARANVAGASAGAVNGQKESEWATFDRPVGIVVFRHQTGQAGIIREEQDHSSRLRRTGLEQDGCIFRLAKRMESPQP